MTPYPLTVHLGRYPSLEALQIAIHKSDCNVSRWMFDLWRYVPIATTPSELGLVAPTMAEIGLFGKDWHGARDHVLKAGLGTECPAEAGALLALQRHLHPREEFLLIMQALTPPSLNNCPYVLTINARDLNVHHTVSGRPISPTTRLVFVPSATK